MPSSMERKLQPEPWGCPFFAFCKWDSSWYHDPFTRLILQVRLQLVPWPLYEALHKPRGKRLGGEESSSEMAPVTRTSIESQDVSTTAEFWCIQPERWGFDVYGGLFSSKKGDVGDSGRAFAWKHGKWWLKADTFGRVRLVVCILYEMLFLQTTGNEVGLGLGQ